jgi:uncharacterized protein with beta-barrel porin domain
MDTLTVRREICATGPLRLRRLLKRVGTVIFLFAAFPIHAQITCPMGILGGNNQNALAGTRFSLPLTVGQSSMTVAVAPFNVSWSVSPPLPPLGAVYIEQSGNGNYTENNVTVGPSPFPFSASINVIAEPDANGVYTIQASTPPCTSAFSTFNVNVFTPVLPQLNTFQGSGQSAVTGTTFPDQLGVVVSEGSGSPTPVANAKVRFIVDGGPAHFSNGMTSINTFTDATGHAFVDLIADTGVTTPTSVAVSVSSLTAAGGYTSIQVLPPAGAPSLTASPPITGTYTAVTGQDFLDQFSIELKDASNLPLPGVTVTFQVNGSTGAQLSNDGTLLGATQSVLTAANGIANIQVTAGNPGAFTLTASTPGFPSTTWNLVTTGASQTLAVISGSNQIAAPQSAFGQPLVVEARVGTVATSGVPIRFDVLSGSAFFGNPQVPLTTITLPTGTSPANASVNVNAGAATGETVVQASSPGFQPVIFILDVATTVLEDVIKISGDAQEGPVNTTLPQPLVAGITPTASVNAPGSPILFEVISGGATFVESGTGTFSALPSGSGLSSAVNLRLGAQPGPVQIRASFPGMTPAVFGAKGNPPSSTATLTKIGGDAQVATTETESRPLRVKFTDGINPVSNGDIDWSVVSGNASLTLSHTKTDEAGESETTLQIGANAGSIRVRAIGSVPGTSIQASADFTLSAGDATLVAVAGSGQTGAIGSTADQVFVFELRGADGSVLPGQTIQFATNDGTLTASSAVTGSDGRASVGLRYGGNPGTVQVTAHAFGTRVSATGVASTFVPLLSIASGNNQAAAAGATLADALVIAITRPPTAAKGLQGLTVNWTVISGGGQLGSATSTTDGNGRSSNTLRLGAVLGAQQVKASIAGVGEVVFVATGSIPASSVLEIVSGNNQQVVPRRPSAPLVVRLRTAAGDSLSGFNVRFTPSDGATVNPTDAVTGADGRAATTVNVTLPGDYTVTASLPDISNIAPVVFNLGNGIANLPNLGDRGSRVARAIDRACPRLAVSSNLTAAQQDLLQRCSELVVNANANSGDVVNALDKMLADESSAQNNAALASAAAQFENLKGRFAALRSGSSGVSMGGLAIMTPTGRLPLSFLPSNLLLGAAEDQTQQVSENFARWGFFATGTVGRGSRDASDSDPGGDFDNYGLTAGVDYRLTDSFILGAALGFNSNDSQLNQSLGGLDSKGYSLSAYGTWFKGDSYYADGVLTLGRNSTDITRLINYTIPGVSTGTTTINQVATGSPDSDQQSFALSIGRDFYRGALSFGPYLRGTYTRLDFDSYVERMSDPSGPGAGLALAVEERQLTSMQGVLGGKLSYTMSTSWGVLMPSLQLEYVKEFKDDEDGLVTSFAFDPTNTSIVIDGEEIDTDFLNIGLGLSGVFANGRSGYIYYEHVAGKDRTSQSSLAIGIRIEF